MVGLDVARQAHNNHTNRPNKAEKCRFRPDVLGCRQSTEIGPLQIVTLIKNSRTIMRRRSSILLSWFTKMSFGLTVLAIEEKECM
jgi:hypothetical protein